MHDFKSREKVPLPKQQVDCPTMISELL
ncbi:protein of unknown function [Cyanobium sp. NIES-981]|nr:protein of unknown function [Cyanobium sp. NIES-981]